MPIYLDTRGHSSLGIGICARCSEKRPLDELLPDPNYFGLFVCPEDLDNLDPYRLAPRETERIDLDYPRPDVSISGTSPTPIYCNSILGITAINPATTWAPLTPYLAGDSITPQNVNDPNGTLPQPWFLCLIGGTSGASAPQWPAKAGQVLGTLEALTSDAPLLFLLDDGTPVQLFADSYASAGDGNVVWMNIGVFTV